MSIAGEIAETEYTKYEQQIAKLRDLVRSAYNEGFTEGMREHTSRTGGNTWIESRTRVRLEEIEGANKITEAILHRDGDPRNNDLANLDRVQLVPVDPLALGWAHEHDRVWRKKDGELYEFAPSVQQVLWVQHK